MCSGRLSYQSSAALVPQIEKFGDPNGVVRFGESALGERVLDEAGDGEGPLDISLPVVRREGVVGDITVRPGELPLIEPARMGGWGHGALFAPHRRCTGRLRATPT